MPDETVMAGKTVLMSSFRNEAPFVLEFVAHHKVAGFDEILIASNDCTDGTAEILDALDAMGVIRHLPCKPPPKVTAQHHAYAQIRRRFGVDAAAWLMILDADELLNIHVGRGRVADLILAQAPETDLILINWAVFGAGGHRAWADEPSSRRFTQRLRTVSGVGLVKSLFRRPAAWKAFSNHHPYEHQPGAPLQVSFAGGLWVEEMPAEHIEFGTLRTVKPRVDSFRLAQINHYITRTADSFALRRDRGRGAAPKGKANDRHTEEYFHRMSSGNVADDTILRYADEVAALIDHYRQNPRLAAALEAGLRLYQVEIDRYWREHHSG